MKTLFIFLLIVCISFEASLAQKRKITGTVLDSKDQQPIIGASVSIPNTVIGTATDLGGKFELSIPETAQTFQVSFLGMKKQVITIGTQTTFEIALEAQAVGLKEVVVTSFAIKREKKSLGYSTQEIKGDDLSQPAVTNLASALQGKVAGLSVKQSSGMPGASAQVTLRGMRSLSFDNQPLYVVDGVPIDGISDISGKTDASNRLLDLNPDDIESINVLKGTSAGALYGLRSINGVILITTKSGKSTKKPKTTITYNGSYTIDKVSRLPQTQKIYGQGINDSPSMYSEFSWGAKISEMGTYKNQLGKDEKAAVYDNIKPFFRTGFTAQNSIDISSSNDMGVVSIGLGSSNQDGIIPTSGLKRYNARFSGQLSPFAKFKIGASVNYSDTHIDKIQGGSNYSNPLLTTYFCPSSYDMFAKDYQHADNQYAQYNYRTIMDNPRWALLHNSSNEDTRRVFGNINANYYFFDWLYVSYRLGIDNYTTKGKDVQAIGSSQALTGEINEFSYQKNYINSNANITFDKDMSEDIHLNVLLGNEIYDTRSTYLQAQGIGLADDGGINNIRYAGNYTASETPSAERVVGFYSQASVDFKRMLYVSLSGRNDITSTMPSKNRSFFYPALSTGFVFTQLALFENNPVLSYGKLRASVSQMGQAGLANSTKNVYVKGGHTNSFLNNKGYSFPAYSYTAFTTGSSLNNPDLKPINITNYEIGTDLRFFDDRIKVDYTYFYSSATDQIFRVPVAPSMGVYEELRNAGEIKTTGHELVLTLVPVKEKDITWEISVNYSKYKSEVVSLADGISLLKLGTVNYPNFGIYAYSGQQYPVIFGTSYLRHNGQIVVDSRQYINGKINATYGMPIIGEQKVLANVAPDFNLSFSNTITYKSFSLNFLIDWQQGGHMYSGMNALLRYYGVGTETQDRDKDVVLNAEKGYVDENGNLVIEGTNDINIKKKQTYYNVLYSITESSIYETTYVRLREVSLSYQLPQEILSKVRIKGASISVSGRNLWLWTKFPNFDPESSTSNGNGTGGFEYAALPNSKSFGVALKLTF